MSLLLFIYKLHDEEGIQCTKTIEPEKRDWSLLRILSINVHIAELLIFTYQLTGSNIILQ